MEGAGFRVMPKIIDEKFEALIAFLNTSSALG
jgi:hypothetical protein